MVPFSIIRAGAGAVFIFVALAIINSFISANVRQWATAEGHDRYIVNFAKWVSIRRRWLWMCLLLSGAVLVWSLLPEAPLNKNIPKEVPLPQPPAPAAPAAPASPVPDNRSPATYGSWQPWQSTIFMNGLDEMKADLRSKIVIARPHMTQPQWFSRAFENDAISDGFEPIVIQQNPTGRDQTGVMIAVPDVEAPSPSALKMQAIIKQLGFEGRFVPLLETPESAPAKEHGNFAIFVGPSPRQ